MTSRTQREYANKWDKENMIVLSCKLRWDIAEEFREYCKAQGKTPNAVFQEYVFSCIGKPGKKESGG